MWATATPPCFLGGKEKSTPKEISGLLGKENIDSFNQSENQGSQVSHGLNYQKLGKELMTQNEIAVMDGGKCILQLRGVRPFFSDKFGITRHPHYKYLADADKKNAFDIERYTKRRTAIVKPDEPFDLYEVKIKSDLSVPSACQKRSSYADFFDRLRLLFRSSLLDSCPAADNFSSTGFQTS